MPYDDLRQFIAALDRAGQLLRISEEVALEPDLGAAGNAVARFGDRAPALLFDNLRGFPQARVVMNVHGSWANHALALGLPPGTAVHEQIGEFGRRWDAFPVPVEHRADPPFLENTLEGADADIFRVLPVFRLNDGDGGFFLDKAAVVSRDPDHPDDFGRQNAGTYRLQVLGGRRLTVIPVATHDLGRHIAAAEARGEDLPIAICLGNEPTIPIVAGMPIAGTDSEYEMSGALRGSPAPIATAPATGLDVPWARSSWRAWWSPGSGCTKARSGVHRGLLGRARGAGGARRADLLSHEALLRGPVPGDAVDRDRLSDGAEYPLARAEGVARVVPRGAGGQCDVHPRAAHDRLDEHAVRGFPLRRRAARHDLAPRARVLQGRDRGR